MTVFHSGHLPQTPKLSGRSNRRQKTFTDGDFSGELFRRRLFPTPQGAPGEDLQFLPKHRSQKATHAPATRVFPAGDCISHAARVRAREPLSGDALPPPASPDAD